MDQGSEATQDTTQKRGPFFSFLALPSATRQSNAPYMIAHLLPSVATVLKTPRPAIRPISLAFNGLSDSPRISSTTSVISNRAERAGALRSCPVIGLSSCSSSIWSLVWIPRNLLYCGLGCQAGGAGRLKWAPKTGPRAKVYVRRFTSESPAHKVDTGSGTPRRSTTPPDSERMKGK